MDTWILAKCRRVCVHKIVAWLALGLAVIGVVISFKDYLVDFFEGPYPMSESQLGALTHPETMQRNFVRVTGSKIVDTGLQQIEVSKDSGSEKRTVTAGYYVLKTGERLLLVKASSTPPLIIDGTLEAIPGDVWNQLFEDQKQRQELSPYFLQVLLNTDSFRFPGYMGLTVAGGLLILVFVFGRKAWNQLQNPSELPVVKRVLGWGDEYRISSEIEKDFKDSVRLKVGSLTLTDKYAVLSHPFKFDVYRVEDLVWAYKRVTRQYYNAIPARKTYNAVLMFNGGSLDAPGNQQKVDSILQYFGQRTPWAIFGHTKEIADAFGENPAGFYQAVEERRRQALR